MESRKTEQEKRVPVVAAYCATFLKPEMLHIYRQIDALKRYRPVVLTRKRENEERFPFSPIIPHPKSWDHEIRRFISRKIRKRPLHISRAEARRLDDTLQAISADLIHIYFGNVATLLLPFIERTNIPVVVSFHGADVRVDLDQPHYRSIMSTMLAKCALVLVRSESLGQAVIHLGCDPLKVRIQRTGIPLDYLHYKERTAPPDGRWILLQACRLIEKKGLPTTLRAFCGFQKKYPKARLIIAGEGPLQESLSALAQQLGIADSVDFTGFLDQQALRDQYSNAHLFIHPSEMGKDGNQEGIPNSLLEAMATGLPCVATLHGGIPEAVENGVSGLLYPEHDLDGITDGLIRLASDTGFYSLMSAAAAKGVGEKFDLKRQIPLLETHYDEARKMKSESISTGSSQN